MDALIMIVIQSESNDEVASGKTFIVFLIRNELIRYVQL